jgi:hypothetical protein
VSNLDMNSYHWWRWLSRAVTAVVGLLVVGYGSSFMTLGRCESLTAQRVARELGTRDLFVPANDGSSAVDYPGSAAILRKSGFNVQSCEGAETLFDCFPWAGVARARMVYPFVVDVRWGLCCGANDWGRYSHQVSDVLRGCTFPDGYWRLAIRCLTDRCT